MTQPDTRNDIFSNLEIARASRALVELEEAARQSREFFDAGHYDAAQLEVDRCRRAVRTLDDIRREQQRKALR